MLNHKLDSSKSGARVIFFSHLCLFRKVYRLFTLPQSEDLDELLAVLDANPSAKVASICSDALITANGSGTLRNSQASLLDSKVLSRRSSLDDPYRL